MTTFATWQLLYQLKPDSFKKQHSLQDYLYTQLIHECGYQSLTEQDFKVLKDLFVDDNRATHVEQFINVKLRRFYKVQDDVLLLLFPYMAASDVRMAIKKLSFSEASVEQFLEYFKWIHATSVDENDQRAILFDIFNKIRQMGIHNGYFDAYDHFVAAVLLDTSVYRFFINTFPYDQDLFFYYDVIVSLSLPQPFMEEMSTWMSHAYSDADNFKKWEQSIRSLTWDRKTYTRLKNAQKKEFDIAWHPYYQDFLAVFGLFGDNEKDVDRYFNEQKKLSIQHREESLYLN